MMASSSARSVFVVSSRSSSVFVKLKASSSTVCRLLPTIWLTAWYSHQYAMAGFAVRSWLARLTKRLISGFLSAVGRDSAIVARVALLAARGLGLSSIRELCEVFAGSPGTRLAVGRLIAPHYGEAGGHDGRWLTSSFSHHVLLSMLMPPLHHSGSRLFAFFSMRYPESRHYGKIYATEFNALVEISPLWQCPTSCRRVGYFDDATGKRYLPYTDS